MYIHTKKAKDGYLYVNKFIMDKVISSDCDWSKLKILYVYNNKTVMTKKEVMRVLRLRKKHIQNS